MATDKMITTYTPIWNCTMSGANRIFHKGEWKENGGNTSLDYTVRAGLKFMLLVSFASVIEGVLKTYLTCKIKRLANSRYELMEAIKNSDSNDLAITFNHSSLEEKKIKLRSCKSNIKRIVLIYDYKKKDTFLGKMNLWFKKMIRKIKYCLRLSESISLKDEKDLLKIVKKVERRQWKELLKDFEMIEGLTLEDVLSNHNCLLYDDLEMIFRFRNFLIHSNNFQQKSNSTKFYFEGESNRLATYMEKRNIKINYTKGRHLVETLVTDDLIVYFKEVLDEFMFIEEFNNHFELTNLRNQIWKK